MRSLRCARRREGIRKTGANGTNSSDTVETALIAKASRGMCFLFFNFIY